MIVFLLGIPGCGKSEIYRRLVERLRGEGLFDEFKRVDDFPKLWEVFMQDKETGAWQRCRQTQDGGYKVTDNTVWDDILKEVNTDIIKMIDSGIENTLLFIEFSRPDYIHSILNNFSGEIINDSIAVYLDVPFDTCWERNVRRHEKAVSEGTDDHLVSREEMEETYGSDDKEDLAEGLPFPVVFIKNDSKDEHDFTKLDEGVEMVLDILKKRVKEENG